MTEVMLSIGVFLIFLLFLREVGIPKLIYEEIYTNPKTKKFILIFGDILYMVGGSIIASVAFAYIVPPYEFMPAPLAIGIAFAAVGSYLRK